MLRPSLDHKSIAVFAGQEDFAVEGNGGGAEGRGHGHAAAFVLDRAGLGINASKDAALKNEAAKSGWPEWLPEKAAALRGIGHTWLWLPSRRGQDLL
jgi:hypothetical protein